MTYRNAPEIISFPVGLLDVNCYLVYPKQDGVLYIIDPGGNAEKILKQVERFHASSYQVMLTHAHVDHISALGELNKALNFGKVYLHPEDKDLYKNTDDMSKALIGAENGSAGMSCVVVEDGE